MKTIDLAKRIAQLASDKKAEDIIILDLQGIADLFDYFLICSAANDRHLRVITDYIIEELKKEKIKLLSREGGPETGWVLLDYGDLIVHIFLKETRDFYQIERLFKDAATSSYLYR